MEEKTERRARAERRAKTERRTQPERRLAERRKAPDRRVIADRRITADRRGEIAPPRPKQPVRLPRRVTDREKLTEMVRTLTETLPTVTNFLAAATQHARACQKGDLLMQAMRARAAFGSLGDAIRDGEAHLKRFRG
jgi:hypothetical protein